MLGLATGTLSVPVIVVKELVVAPANVVELKDQT